MRVFLAVLTLVLFTSVSACRLDEDGRAEGTVQGWTASERTAWYWGTQGSRLMPMAWFTALEQASGEARFASMENLAGFGFLTPPENSPSPLPIGFSADQQADTAFRVTGIRWYAGQAGGDKTAEKWVGLNCAACHTARMSYGETTLTIDGGPNLLDFQSFIEELDAAIAATKSDSAKWDRFATKVLSGKDTPGNRAKLDIAYAGLLAWQQKTAAMNQTPLRYGFGRLDAVGHILNKILMFTGAPASAGNASNAPVSYPFLWGIANQDRVQWNGIARNSRFALPGDPFEYGALGRNTGEVVGVFWRGCDNAGHPDAHRLHQRCDRLQPTDSRPPNPRLACRVSGDRRDASRQGRNAVCGALRGLPHRTGQGPRQRGDRANGPVRDDDA